MPTAPTAYRYQTVRGRTIRISRVDSCGNPIGGASSQFVTQGFITVTATKNMDSGNEVKQYRADDTVDLYVPGRQTLTNFGLEIDFSVNDTGVIPMMTGDPAVLDWQSAVSGWEEQGLTASNVFFALELWTGVANPSGAACVATAQQFGYHVWPFVGNAYTDTDAYGNSATNNKIMATTFQGNQWGKGPYNVVATDASNTPGRLLVAMGTSAHKHFELTTVAPPTPTATAGPATFTLPTPY